MNQVLSAINSVTKPIHAIYVKAFNANKYAAGIGFSSAITLALFFVMVILISLGDTGMKEDTSVKLADIVMPDREIDTFMTEVEKPDKPEEQPEDIAQPELDLAPLTGIDVSIKGRILQARSFGKLSFFDLLDNTGKIQLLIDKSNMSKKELSFFENYDSGDIIGALGEIMKTKKGELSIKVKSSTILSKSLKTLPEKWHGL